MINYIKQSKKAAEIRGVNISDKQIQTIINELLVNSLIINCDTNGDDNFCLAPLVHHIALNCRVTT